MESIGDCDGADSSSLYLLALLVEGLGDPAPADVEGIGSGVTKSGTLESRNVSSPDLLALVEL